MNKFALIHQTAQQGRESIDADYQMRLQARREENQRLAREADLKADKRRRKKERVELTDGMRQAVVQIKKKVGISTTELAKYMGVTNDTVLGIIGCRKSFSPEHMAKIQWVIENPPERPLGFVAVPPEIIEKLRALRKARGCVWNIIAHETGVPVTIFYDIVTRHNRNISTENLERIQKYLVKHPRQLA